MGKHHSHDDTFGSFQASVGRVSASLGVVSAWALLVVALGVAVAGVWIFVSTHQDKQASAERQNAAKWWLIGGGLGILVAALNLVFSRWWNGKVQHSEGFAEAAGTMAEFSALSDLLRPPTPPPQLEAPSPSTQRPSPTSLFKFPGTPAGSGRRTAGGRRHSASPGLGARPSPPPRI